LTVFYTSFIKIPTFHHQQADAARKNGKAATPACRAEEARRKFNAVLLLIYFAALFVSLQFIAIINCDSKKTWEQYYLRPLHYS